VVERLERDGRGLNLTEQVRNGILCHSGRAPAPSTLEGAIVRITDRFAYLNHDIDDSIRAGLLDPAMLPGEAIAVLGQSGSARIDALVTDLVEQSAVAGEIVQGERAALAMAALRDFMFEHIYLGPVARREHSKIETVIRSLFDHYCANPELLPPGEEPLQTRVTDYLAGMTDRFCIRAYEELAVPRAFAR
jgi:dGTPase